MLFFPCLDAVNGEQIVGVHRRLFRAIDDVGGSDETLDGNAIGRAVGIILAADPVPRRIEMRARMLAEFEPVPRPIGAVGVVMGNAVDLNRRGILANLGRKLDHRGFRPERRRQVDDPNRSGEQRRCQIR